MATGSASTTAEQQIEDALIAKLGALKYTLRPDINHRAALEANFRQKFEALNKVTLTDGEFDRLLAEIVTADGFDAAVRLRERNGFVRDDGTPLNYTLVNIKDWCKNTFEVASQLKINTTYSHHRYDVVLLINGVPAVQIELKSLGISPRKAMQQIVDYKADPGNGYTNSLLCFVQLFVVSNRDRTHYFTNNNPKHFAFDADERFLPVYEFADEHNKKITHLDDFAEAFLPKCTLGRMISRYTVLVATDRQLLMMRPYQMYAVQQIVACMEDGARSQDAPGLAPASESSAASGGAGGYIWHTTGSGKTLTSFKASTLLKGHAGIHKVLFVVDRKDLDKQTRDEFNKFQAGSVEENTNTAALVRRLLSDDYADKVIVTTIQKLGLALDEQSKRNKKRVGRGQETHASQLAPLRDQRMAVIFDECHRSQFGQTHQTIRSFFPRAQFFGFTGTPIFEENATQLRIEGDTASHKTTADIFEQQLHAYTITDAIEDRNVLKFHVDYYKPSDGLDVKPSGELTKKAIAESILDKHDAATNGRKFNALFATGSINDAIEYFHLLDAMQLGRTMENPAYRPLKITAVFSPPAEGNADVRQLQEDLPQELADNAQQPDEKKEALTRIIADYNHRYGTNHSVAEFDAYYQDVQQRIKSQKFPDADTPGKNGEPGGAKIDLVIVVDMLLTGFDSKHLNTLYVDKNLRHHGLIQAFSRTNRVLNDTKPHGQILDFRGQQENVDDAIRLFSGLEHAGATAEASREIWLVEPAPVVIEKLKAAKAELDAYFHGQGLESTPSHVADLKGDDARAGFIEQYKRVQKLSLQLAQYTDLTDEQSDTIEATLPRDTARGFRGAYLETAKQLKSKAGGDGAPNPAVDDLDFELVLFASATIDYDYIMKLIADLSQAGEAEAAGKPAKKSKLTREELIGLIESDAKFLDEKDQIAAYVRSLEAGRGLDEAQVKAGYARFKAQRQAEQLDALATEHGLAAAPLGALVDEVLTRMVFDGERLTDLFAPLDLGWKDRQRKEQELMRGLIPLLKQRANDRRINGLDAWE